MLHDANRLQSRGQPQGELLSAMHAGVFPLDQNAEVRLDRRMLVDENTCIGLRCPTLADVSAQRLNDLRPGYICKPDQYLLHHVHDVALPGSVMEISSHGSCQPRIAFTHKYLGNSRPASSIAFDSLNYHMRYY